MNMAERRISTVYLICGFIGGGKTTFSKKLARETGAIRVTKDEWMIKIFGNKAPDRVDFEQLDTNVANLATEFALELAGSGMDVILDEGYWVRSQRDELKERVEQAGAKWVLYYVETPMEQMKARVVKRTTNPGNESFEISEEMFESYVKYWEPPTEDEKFILAK